MVSRQRGRSLGLQWDGKRKKHLVVAQLINRTVPLFGSLEKSLKPGGEKKKTSLEKVMSRSVI